MWFTQPTCCSSSALGCGRGFGCGKGGGVNPALQRTRLLEGWCAEAHPAGAGPGGNFTLMTTPDPC